MNDWREDKSPFASNRNMLCILGGCALSTISVAGVAALFFHFLPFPDRPTPVDFFYMVVAIVFALTAYAGLAALFDWLLRGVTRRWAVDRYGKRMTVRTPHFRKELTKGLSHE